MDVELQTNDLDTAFGWFEVNRFEDGSGYCAELRIRSHGFAVTTEFCVESPQLERFVEEIRRLNTNLAGVATFKAAHEDNYVTFTVGRTGAVLVAGEIHAFIGEHDQALRFGFRTDQTCLGPLIR